MRAKASGLIAACLGLSAIAGCPVEETRTNNQGGGSLVSAGIKLLNARLGNLTPDEVQIIVDRVDERKPGISIELSDEQAQAIVDFLEENQLNSIQAVSAVIENPGNLVIPESLQSLVDAGDLPEAQRQQP